MIKSLNKCSKASVENHLLKSNKATKIKYQSTFPRFDVDLKLQKMNSRKQTQCFAILKPVSNTTANIVLTTFKQNVSLKC